MDATRPMPALLGGALCLDFVNTVDPRHADERREYLGEYADLVAWARHAGAVTDAEERRLLDAAPDARAAAAVHARALVLREALYALLTPNALDAAHRREALDLVNGELARASAMARLVRDGETYRWGWADAHALDRPLWPVVRSAAELLAGDALARVHECAGVDGTCGWLFLDSTKNASRRWCSMQGCGNRAKARRHYERVRGRGSRASARSSRGPSEPRRR